MDAKNYRQTEWRWFAVAGWIVAGWVCLLIDVPLSRWCLADSIPGEIRALFHRGEVFGHAYGVLGIAIPLFLVDRTRRWQLALVVLSFVAAGLSADLLKLLFWRLRPYAYQELGWHGSTFVGAVGLGSWLEIKSLSHNAYHSFPSAHMAGAVAFACGLGRLYPAARSWFWVLAVLCAGNRIDGGAHFASDTCWGTSLGFLITHVLTDRWWMWCEDRDGRSASWRDAAPIHWMGGPVSTSRRAA